jgi:hypothetical protein
MKSIIYFFISVSLCACSNLRIKESCEHFIPGDYRSNQTEEYDYKQKKELCEIQHGIKIDREQFAKDRAAQQIKILKENCTCEEGFHSQAFYQTKYGVPENPSAHDWTKECSKISMDKEYLRGIEVAKGAEAKKTTEEEMKNSQKISSETAQLFCKSK